MGRGKRRYTGRASARQALPFPLLSQGWHADVAELKGLKDLPPVREEQGDCAWETLAAAVPFAAPSTGAVHAFQRTLHRGQGWSVVSHQPGKHALESYGGDFGVQVVSSRAPHSIDGAWFPSHPEIFADVAEKRAAEPEFMLERFGPALTAVVFKGACPQAAAEALAPAPELPGLELEALLCLCQAIALAEHRSYSQFEADHDGGRYLPMRIIHGLLEGNWSGARVAELFDRDGANMKGLAALYQLRQERFGKAKGPGLGWSPAKYLELWQGLETPASV